MMPTVNRSRIWKTKARMWHMRAAMLMTCTVLSRCPSWAMTMTGIWPERTLQPMSIDVANAYEHVPLNRERNYTILPLVDNGCGHVYMTTAEAGAPESSRFNGSDEEPPARQHNEVPLGIQDNSADDDSRFNSSSDEPPTRRGREGRQHHNIEGLFESTLEVNGRSGALGSRTAGHDGRCHRGYDARSAHWAR